MPSKPDPTVPRWADIGLFARDDESAGLVCKLCKTPLGGAVSISEAMRLTAAHVNLHRLEVAHEEGSP